MTSVGLAAESNRLARLCSYLAPIWSFGSKSNSFSNFWIAVRFHLGSLEFFNYADKRLARLWSCLAPIRSFGSKSNSFDWIAVRFPLESLKFFNCTDKNDYGNSIGRPCFFEKIHLVYGAENRDIFAGSNFPHRLHSLVDRFRFVAWSWPSASFTAVHISDTHWPILREIGTNSEIFNGTIELSFRQRRPPIDFLQRLHHLVRLSVSYLFSPDERERILHVVFELKHFVVLDFRTKCRLWKEPNRNSSRSSERTSNLGL